MFNEQEKGNLGEDLEATQVNQSETPPDQEPSAEIGEITGQAAEETDLVFNLPASQESKDAEGGLESMMEEINKSITELVEKADNVNENIEYTTHLISFIDTSFELLDESILKIEEDAEQHDASLQERLTTLKSNRDSLKKQYAEIKGKCKVDLDDFEQVPIEVEEKFHQPERNAQNLREKILPELDEKVTDLNAEILKFGEFLAPTRADILKALEKVTYRQEDIAVHMTKLQFFINRNEGDKEIPIRGEEGGAKKVSEWQVKFEAELEKLKAEKEDLHRLADEYEADVETMKEILETRNKVSEGMPEPKKESKLSFGGVRKFFKKKVTSSLNWLKKSSANKEQ